MDEFSDDLHCYDPSLPLLEMDSSMELMLENPTLNLHSLMDFSNDCFFLQQPEFPIFSGFSVTDYSNSALHPQSMDSMGDGYQESTRKKTFGKRKKGRCHEKPKEVIQVRARRGQATDSHSIAERARREKINERLRSLQGLVPGCYKTMGMAAMLDEIIRYVQSLQNQIEFLSMKLSAADSFYNFCFEMEAMETQQATQALMAHRWSGW